MNNDEALMYELVEQEDGNVALVRVDGHGEPLVAIKFSQESLEFLGQSKMEVAKAMIEAGLDTVSDMTDAEVDEEVPEEGALIH